LEGLDHSCPLGRKVETRRARETACSNRIAWDIEEQIPRSGRNCIRGLPFFAFPRAVHSRVPVQELPNRKHGELCNEDGKRALNAGCQSGPCAVGRRRRLITLMRCFAAQPGGAEIGLAAPVFFVPVLCRGIFGDASVVGDGIRLTHCKCIRSRCRACEGPVQNGQSRYCGPIHLNSL